MKDNFNTENLPAFVDETFQSTRIVLTWFCRNPTRYEHPARCLPLSPQTLIMQLQLAVNGGLISLAGHLRPSTNAKLPLEILLWIFQYFNNDTAFRPYEKRTCSQDGEEAPPNLVPLMLVCRTWRSVVEPLLYNRLKFIFYAESEYQTRLKLQRTLLERPGLCRHVQHLQLTFFDGEPSFEDFVGFEYHEDDLVAILQLLPLMQPKTLILDGRMGRWLDPQLTVALAQVGFEEIVLHYVQFDFVVAYLRRGRGKKQTHLRLEESSCCPGTSDTQFWREARSAYLLPFPRWKAPDEMLHMYKEQGTVYSDGVVCRGVSGLRKLGLYVQESWDGNPLYIRPMIQKVLDTQTEWLEELRLDCYLEEDSRLPDLSQMPRLRSLSVSGHNLFADSAQAAARNLQHVEHLVIDTNGCDQRIPYKGKFDQQSADWVFDFAAAGSVKHIHVDFELCRYNTLHEQNCLPLEVLKPRLAALGVKLTWPEVDERLTEDDWNALHRMGKSQDEQTELERLLDLHEHNPYGKSGLTITSHRG